MLTRTIGTGQRGSNERRASKENPGKSGTALGEDGVGKRAERPFVKGEKGGRRHADRSLVKGGGGANVNLPWSSARSLLERKPVSEPEQRRIPDRDWESNRRDDVKEGSSADRSGAGLSGKVREKTSKPLWKEKEKGTLPAWEKGAAAPGGFRERRTTQADGEGGI